MPPTQPSLTSFTQRLFNDFEFFVEQIWLDRGLDRVAPLGELERDILRFAAGADASWGWFRVVLASRGVGKTHLAVATLALWRLFRDNDRRILIVSKSEKHARDTITLLREWITGIWFLQHLAPRAGQRDSATKIDVGPSTPSRQASLAAIGIDGQLEGNRADSIYPDDVETKVNTITLEAREDLAARVSEFKAILYPRRDPKDGGRLDPPEIVFSGTYHHEESVYLKLPQRGYTPRTWTLVYPSPGESQLNLAPLISEALDSGRARPGEPTMPHRFGAEEVATRQAEGRRHFLMQYQLACDLGESNRYPLRLSDLIVVDDINPFKAPITIAWGTQNNAGSTAITDIDNMGFQGDHLHRPIQIDPELAPFTATRMRIDPAGKGDDKVGVAIIGHIAGFLWVKYCAGLDGGYSPANLARLATLARDHDARSIVVEDNWGGGMFEELFRPILAKFFLRPGQDPARPNSGGGWAASVESIHSTGQKELRIIDTLEPVMSVHRLIVSRAVITPTFGPASGGPENQLQYQLTRITRERGALKEDGAIDALAGCVKDWQTVLRADPSAAAERVKTRTIDDELRDLRRSLGAAIAPAPSFLTYRP